MNLDALGETRFDVKKKYNKLWTTAGWPVGCGGESIYLPPTGCHLPDFPDSTKSFVCILLCKIYTFKKNIFD